MTFFKSEFMKSREKIQIHNNFINHLSFPSNSISTYKYFEK